jgi:hypothetical protein
MQHQSITLDTDCRSKENSERETKSANDPIRKGMAIIIRIVILAFFATFAEAYACGVETTSESIGDIMIDVRVKVKGATEHERLGAQIPRANSSLLGKFWFNPGMPGVRRVHGC